VKASASIETPLAWDITQGSSNVLVAVLDSGLSPSAEFAGRVVPGYNFAYGTADTTDDHGHGTAVAGTVAATGNNATVVAGVDWHCRLMPVKVLNSANNGLYSWWAQGIDFAVNKGAKVINLSAGGSGSSTLLTSAITNAIAHGTIFVTITHNDGTGVIRYPGNLTNCITVGATDEHDRRTGFSNYGPEIDLCAPGTNIYTVSQAGTLTYWWGTSFSAPLVTGTCALLAALRPEISHDEARLLLCAGAEDGVGDATDTTGFDNYYGWGRLNAYNSLLLAQTRVDRVSWSNHVVRLSWPSPANASNKQPYQVQFKNTVTAAWTTATAPAAFVYTTNRTSWSQTNIAASAQFYRVRLRPLP
jgi:subtilisin family serine protease